MTSVTVRSADRDRIAKAVAAYAADLRRQHPEIERMVWFGSWVTGLPTPGSDVDLCLILAGSDKRPRDRISEYLPVGFPVGVDLVVYTREEFERSRDASPGWHQAITSGVDV